MSEYHWVVEGALIRRASDGAFIPWPPVESEGAKVQAYLDAGGVIGPVPQPSVETQRASILSELGALDLKSVRALRAVSAGTASDHDRAVLVEIEAQAAALRYRLAALDNV